MLVPKSLLTQTAPELRLTVDQALQKIDAYLDGQPRLARAR